MNVVKHLPGQRLDPTNSDSSGHNTVPPLPRDHFDFLHMLCLISRKDANFWQLVSNSIVQISSVISMMMSMYQATKLTKEAWAWAWVLALFRTCSACVRMPLYSYLYEVEPCGLDCWDGSAVVYYVVACLFAPMRPGRAVLVFLIYSKEMRYRHIQPLMTALFGGGYHKPRLYSARHQR